MQSPAVPKRNAALVVGDVAGRGRVKLPPVQRIVVQPRCDVMQDLNLRVENHMKSTLLRLKCKSQFPVDLGPSSGELRIKPTLPKKVSSEEDVGAP